MTRLASSTLESATHPMISPFSDDVRHLATAVANQAEGDIAEAHAGIAPALAARARRWAGLAEPLHGRSGLSLPAHSATLADVGVRLDSLSGGTRLSGRQRFVSPKNADWLLVVVAHGTDGAFLDVGMADRGLRIEADEPAFGLAATVRGWIEIDRVAAPGEIHFVPTAEIGAALSSLRHAEELLHLALDHGGIRGFLAAARTFLLTRSRPWDSTGLQRSTDDPHIVRQWGTFIAQEHALGALYEEALREADQGLTGPGPRIARSYARSLVRPLINGVVELLGASATSEQYGFDAFWRDLTAHELDDPGAFCLAEIGAERCRRVAER